MIFLVMEIVEFTLWMNTHMLVLLSNLHLTDGSCGDHSASDRLTGALNELQHVLKESSRNSIEKIDVVLLGDTFDFVKSRKWQKHGTRPWDYSLQSSVANTVEIIFEEIVARYSHGFRILDRLLENGIEVFSLDRKSRRVPLQLHYMVGDTDRMLHHFGPAFDMIRQRICDALCLSNPPDIPFPHEPIESETILSLMREHGIFARHGDLQDPWSYEGDRLASSVNELVQIELVQPFVRDVLQNHNDELSDNARENIFGMIRANHVLEFPAKLVCFIDPPPENANIARHILASWHDRLDQFLRHKELQDRTAWQPLDLVAELRKRLTIEENMQRGVNTTSHFWLDQRVEIQKQIAWIPSIAASKSDSSQTRFFVTAHYSQDVVIEMIDRSARVDSVPLRRAA